MAKQQIKIKIDWGNYSGFIALRKSSQMVEVIESYADSIANRAGEGYETYTKQMPTRAYTGVYAATKEAKEDNLKNNTLLKAVRK